MRDLLLIESLDIQYLMDEYRLFLLGLLPGMFVLAVIAEYFSDMDPVALVKERWCPFW